jgi:hypothetical protein
VVPLGLSRDGMDGSVLTCGIPASPLRTCSAWEVVWVADPLVPCQCVCVSAGGLSRCTTDSNPESRVPGRVVVLWWWRSVAVFRRFDALWSASISSRLACTDVRGTTGWRNCNASSSLELGASKRRFFLWPDILLSL